MKGIVAYTYLLTWPSGLKYYGVRYAKGCKPSELLETYMSSSRHVRELIKNEGRPAAEVRRVFNDVDRARQWETKVLKRLKVVHSETWVNKTDNFTVAPELCDHGWSIASRQKSSASHKNKPGPNRGRKFSEETKMKMRLAQLGKKRPDQSQRMKGNTLFAGRCHTQTTKLAMSASHAARNNKE